MLLCLPSPEGLLGAQGCWETVTTGTAVNVLTYSFCSFLAFPKPKWECALFDSYSESMPANQQPRDLNRMEVKDLPLLISGTCVELDLLAHVHYRFWKIPLHDIFSSYSYLL